MKNNEDRKNNINISNKNILNTENDHYRKSRYDSNLIFLENEDKSDSIGSKILQFLKNETIGDIIY